jgi:hypothetical protein
VEEEGIDCSLCATVAEREREEEVCEMLDIEDDICERGVEYIGG